MNDSPVVVAQLWLYPIKSLGGVRVERAAITGAGSLALDREWAVVDEDGNKLFQGDLPRMALTRCRLDAGAITVTAPELPDLEVPREQDGPPCTITMYKHRIAAIDCGDGAAAWLTEALGQRVRLVRVGAGGHSRPGLNPVHVLSLPSLAALNAALSERGEAPVEIERFRPNLVLDTFGGALSPYFEERYGAIRFGDLDLTFREPCVRCQLPNISRVNASRGRQPLKLIGALSRGRASTALGGFGIYARLSGGGEIRAGISGTPQALRPPLAS